jgi:hypothetical protein
LAFAQNEAQKNTLHFSTNVGVAANIRYLFKEPAREAFGLLAAGNLTPVVRKEGESFWSAAKKANREAKKNLANPKKVLEMLSFNLLDPTLIDAMWFTAYGNFKNKTALRLKKIFLNPTEKPKRELGVTNIGKVTIDDSNQVYKLKSMFFIPPYWVNYEKVIGVVTASGIMNISILTDSRYIENDIIERFKQLTLKYIEEATEHGSNS